MKNRNPFLSLLVLWIGALCVSLCGCIMGILRGELVASLIDLALIVIDCIFIGWTICKYSEFRMFMKNTQIVEKTLGDFEKLMKSKENEPFKEFEDNGKQ